MGGGQAAVDGPGGGARVADVESTTGRGKSDAVGVEDSVVDYGDGTRGGVEAIRCGTDLGGDIRGALIEGVGLGRRKLLDVIGPRWY